MSSHRLKSSSEPPPSCQELSRSSGPHSPATHRPQGGALLAGDGGGREHCTERKKPSCVCPLWPEEQLLESLVPTGILSSGPWQRKHRRKQVLESTCHTWVARATCAAPRRTDSLGSYNRCDFPLRPEESPLLLVWS